MKLYILVQNCRKFVCLQVKTFSDDPIIQLKKKLEEGKIISTKR